MDKRISPLTLATQPTFVHVDICSPDRSFRHTSPTVRRVTSHSMFCGADELEIVHQGALYRLRQTSLGKLILTK
ncbi:hemin uptake protein HemP [Zwartia vadi]|uniref:hemin uptake protein HemP n=1 Tax=Zwartia vadi TaxID=3058168 RepID=UPI0025B2C8BB|nr:hemin uptake protein HemP [Zwartia vadi]MDN3986624.1 hemin uptake protein HemP [Zwartia vadi]